MSSGHAISPQSSPPKFAAIVTGAGLGRRMGGVRKALLELNGRPIMHYAIERLMTTPGCEQIIPVLHPEDCKRPEVAAALRREFGIERVVPGGSTRQESAMAGLRAVREDLELVLIHDAVRPLVRCEVIQKVAHAAWQHGAAIAAVPVSETVKEVAPPDCIVSTPARERLWLARTPQGFRKDIILRAHVRAAEDGFCGTDDAQLVERLGLTVRVVEDAPDNIKITTAHDLIVAAQLLRLQAGLPGGAP